MTICPLCAHQQVQGNECDQCGRLLVEAPAVEIAAGGLPGLEATALVSSSPAPAPAAMLETIETNQLASGPDLPPLHLVELEQTAMAPVGEVAVQALGEVDLGRYVDTSPRTQVSVRACRYCGNVQPQGGLCNRCGGMIPKLELVKSPAAAARRAGEAEMMRCKQCGGRVEVGTICGCGAQN